MVLNEFVVEFLLVGDGFALLSTVNVWADHFSLDDVTDHFSSLQNTKTVSFGIVSAF